MEEVATARAARASGRDAIVDRIRESLYGTTANVIFHDGESIGVFANPFNGRVNFIEKVSAQVGELDS